MYLTLRDLFHGEVVKTEDTMEQVSPVKLFIFILLKKTNKKLALTALKISPLKITARICSPNTLEFSARQYISGRMQNKLSNKRRFVSK